MSARVDVIFFCLEKIASNAPLNGVFARFDGCRWSSVAYLGAAAKLSLKQAVKCMEPEADSSDRWRRRSFRLTAGEAFRRGEYDRAKSLALRAAGGERFVPYRSEFIAWAGLSAFKACEWAEALSLLDDAIGLWKSSRAARLLEPRLVNVATYFKWAAMNESGLGKEGLRFLHEVAITERASERCERWLELLSAAYSHGDEKYVRIGFEGAMRHCHRSDPRLNEWKDAFSEQSRHP